MTVLDTPVTSAPAISIVIPTFNEACNITELLERLAAAIPAGELCEVIFVDDSVDDTPQIIEVAARDCPLSVRLLHRDEPTGGLGGAVVEGLRLAAAPWVVVMDADLQHPPALVPELVNTGVRSGADLVVASRYTSGGSREGLDGPYRMLVSKLSTLLVKTIFPRRLSRISDPMSGFFAVRREAVRPEQLRPLGYKILLELAVRCGFRHRAEMPYAFGERFAGDSKSSLAEGFRFMRHLAMLRLSTAWIPRFTVAVAGLAIALIRPGPWLALVILLLGVGLVRAAGWHGRQLRIIVLALGVFVSAIDYLAWRLTVLSWTFPGMLIGVPLLLAELHAALHTVGLHTTVWPADHRRTPPVRKHEHVPRPVYVFVPTVDEGTAIVEQTLRGILAARDTYLAAHPGGQITVVVCNDGGVAGAPCSDAVIELCASLGVECVTRSVPGGAKAGNIEHARQLVGATGDSLIAIFDADQIPKPDFFIRTIRPFDDPTVGWVQTGQFYGNRDNPVARWADDQQSLFYRLLCPGKAAYDSAFICGTNVVLRAAALDEIGGLPTDSVTEDFAASIQLAPRWGSIYLPGVLAVGLGPVDLQSYLKQQERWARGTLSALRSRWRELLLPRRNGLRSQQRLQYGLAVTHYLCGVRDLIFVLAPVLFLLTGLSGVHGATLADFFAHFIPYCLLAMLAFLHAARGTTSWRAIVIGYGSFPSLVKAAWMTTVGNSGRFTITPKKRTGSSPWLSSWPHLAVLAACLASLAVSLAWHRDPAFWLADFWLVYLCALTSAHLWLVHLDACAARAGTKELQRVPRPDAAPFVLRHLRSRLIPVLVGVAVTAACSVATAALADNEVSGGRAPLSVRGRTAVGVSGTSESHVPRLQEEIGVGFGLQGRTIEIGDQFDDVWAGRVTRGGGIPWLTLVLGRNGRPDLNSGLTAIANGVDDDALTRWARNIARYGRPIYLTMLPEVDRNYPTTSAVSRGGIPQDVPRAWRHLRDLFGKARATNVAWVWNPADPARDQAYSPPDGQIDAVALTLYEYPGTRWVAPRQALADVAARHPGRPMLLNVSTAGPAKRRAEWMLQLGSAISAQPDVAGLVYQDSGPVHGVDDPAALPWSMTADLTFQETVRHVFRELAS